jgi:sarcosine oxidase subunit gamma
MAKLCAVDLSAESFVVGQIAQTSVARINAIVMNVSDAQAPKFNILCDRASSLYLWNVLLDAIAEFDGKAIGIQGLL